SVAAASLTKAMSGSAMTSPTVWPVTAHGPDTEQLQISFSHTSWSMSSNTSTRKPALAQVSSTFLSRGVIGPPNSPRRTSSMPLWCAWPGARIEAPKPPTTPTMTLSFPRTEAAVSGPPRPFWMERTGVSLFNRGWRVWAAAATCIALVARTTRSQGPASCGSVVAFKRTVRSPEAPSTLSPRARIASMCSCQRSMAHTSWPAEAKSAAYTEPMAPVPTIAIFNFCSNHFEETGGAHAAADAHRYDHKLRLATLALDECMADEARAAHPVGMAERDGAAVHVEALVRDADAVAAVNHLDREGFVQLPQVDVADVLASLLEEL